MANRALDHLSDSTCDALSIAFHISARAALVEATGNDGGELAGSGCEDAAIAGTADELCRDL